MNASEILETTAATEPILDIASIKQAMDGFHPEKLLPDLTKLFGHLPGLCRLAVMIGPVVMLALGLSYLFLAPKEANYYLGYRCYFGMGSIHSWRFTQRLAGLLFTAAGAIFTVVTLGISAGFGNLEPEAMAWKAVGCLVWQAVAAVVINLFVSLAAAYFFDRKGAPRRHRKKA